jgi:hypothetical protein
MKRPRPHPEMIEGPEAFARFQEATKAILRVPKSSLPPSPFRRAGKKAKKRIAPKS